MLLWRPVCPACVLPRQLEVELQRARGAEKELMGIALEEARQRRRSEEEVARLTHAVHDGYGKIASVEAMAQQLQDSMNLRACLCACVCGGG